MVAQIILSCHHYVQITWFSNRDLEYHALAPCLVVDWTLDHCLFLHSSDPNLVLVTDFFCFVMLVTSCKVIKLYFVVVLIASNLKQLTVKNSIKENIL